MKNSLSRSTSHKPGLRSHKYIAFTLCAGWATVRHERLLALALADGPAISILNRCITQIRFFASLPSSVSFATLMIKSLRQTRNAAASHCGVVASSGYPKPVYTSARVTVELDDKRTIASLSSPKLKNHRLYRQGAHRPYRHRRKPDASDGLDPFDVFGVPKVVSIGLAAVASAADWRPCWRVGNRVQNSRTADWCCGDQE
jgi:hypothetical protein